MPEVISSLLRRVEYDESSQRLTVTFTSGKTYAYNGVPKRTYTELLAAGSKGSFFNDSIRGAFPYGQVRSSRGR